MNTPLTEMQYKTFSSLLEDVRVDFKGISNSGRIDPQQLLKVVLKVTYDLGLRINKTKEAVIEIDHNKGRLPDDFYVMNSALICGEFSVNQILPQGTTIHQVDVVPSFTDWIDTPQCKTDDCRSMKWPESNRPICLTKCNTGYQLIQQVHTETRTYKYMLPIRFTNPMFVDCNCPNFRYRCHDEAFIKDGFVFTNFECGNLYINYEGSLVDESGELLVPDQYAINQYYEWALKVKIIQSLFFEGDNSVMNMLKYAEEELRKARVYALSVVNTPDFREMKQVWEANRRAYYMKYYEPMASYPWEVGLRQYGR